MNGRKKEKNFRLRKTKATKNTSISPSNALTVERTDRDRLGSAVETLIGD